MLWSIIQVVGKQGTTFLIFAILAALLHPSDFGILGMAMAWIAFIQAFSEIGFGAALIQSQSVKSKHFSTVFFANIVIGILLTIVGILISWPSALFFKTPQLQPVVAVLSIGFIINSFSLTHVAIAQKKMRFRDLAVKDISSSLIGGGVGIILAYLKFGVWSLVAQSLTTNLIGALILWFIIKWKPAARDFSIQHLKELWPYSSRIFAFNILKYFAQNTDKLVIGYLLGSTALGLYTFAFKIVVFPVSIFVGAIGNYLFPKYAKLQDNIKAIRDSYQFILKAINSTVLPVLILIVFISPILVPYIWGEKWQQAIPLIQILAILALSQSLISPVGQLMKSLGHPEWLFRWSVYITIIVLAFIWFGAYKYGVIGATWGITAAYLTGLPINFFLVQRLTRLTLRNVLSTIYPSTFSGMIAMLPLWWILNNRPFDAALNVITLLFIGSIIYVCTIVLFDRSFLIEILKKFKKRGLPIK